MESNTSRSEAERLLGISEKLLQGRDLHGSRDFAVLAQETEPLLDGSDQILAVADVLLAAERGVGNNQQQHDWYGILQVEPTSTSDADLIKRHYRRLALLLHPDKNRFPYADQAFRLVSQAWSLLSDPHKKSLFDKVHLAQPPPHLRRAAAAAAAVDRTFWTLCPYCYVLFEYPRVYRDCCLKCQRCGRAFEAVEISALPPLVPGQEAYHCCWAVFPMGFVVGDLGSGEKGEGVPPAAPGFPNWMPPVFDAAKKAAPAAVGVSNKKRGRPRLN